MVYLRLLGSPSLESDEVILSGRATQRHRIALLALLALVPGQRLSRDKLLAYLWPERNADSARNLLKVSTYVLREALGERALLSEGDDLRLNPEIIRVDVVELEAALERGDPTSAVALYRAPLLDGFHLSEAPEFERWAARERERLAGIYANALESMAELAEAEQDVPRAVDWWKARAAQDPFDSRVAVRLIRALDANGNRAGALQHAAIHQRLLAEELGITSAPEVAALVERLRREPVAQGAVSQSTASPSPVAAQVARQSAAEGAVAGRTRRSVWLIAATLLVCAALGAAIWSGWPHTPRRESSIVVLPFINLSADRDNEYFSDGLTEEIITRLAAVPDLKVISRTSAMRYKGTARPLREIATELKVGHVLEGSVREDDGRVRISAQLIDADGDKHLWAESYEYRLEDSFRIQQDIAQEVAKALEVRLGERERMLLVRQGTRDPQAYLLYRRGRFLWRARTREGHERAIEYFRRAIERDSTYADAYAAMADVYLTAYQHNFLPEAEASLHHRQAAQRALALDDRSAEAHTAFAVALWWQRDWRGAERELHRAIELNPGHATAHAWYSHLLSGMGRQSEALAETRRSVELDPFDPTAISNYGRHCYLARNFDCAIEQFRGSIDIGDYPPAYAGLAVVYAQKGMTAEALSAVRKGIDLAPERTDFLGDLAYVQALAGETREARASLQRAKKDPMEPFTIARAHTALGEPDSAFAWLERSNWKFPHRAARSDPALDPLRSDPRFSQLSARVEREMGMQR